MVEFFIKTSIDKLVNLLRKKKKIRISETSKILKVSQKQVDDWIFTLEDKGIVDLKYPILGEPEIVLKKVAPEEIALPKRGRIKLETRIIPGKPIKKEELPRFKPRISEKPKEMPKEKAMDIEKLKALENRISAMASKRAEEASPRSVYVTEKLRFLEGKLHELSRKIKEEKEIYETERLILEKIETIENRLAKLSKDVRKEKEMIDVLKKPVKKLKKGKLKKR